MQNALASTQTSTPIPVCLPGRAAFEQALVAALIAAGKLSSAAADRARRVAGETGEPLEKVLSQLGLISEKDIAEAAAAELGLRVALPEDFPDAPVLDGAVSVKFLRETGVLPLAAGNDAITLAMADPLNDYARRAIEVSTGRRVTPVVAALSDIQAAHERQFNPGRGQIGALVEEIEQTDEAGTLEDVDRLRDQASEAPVIRLVNLLIVRAIERRASDIHIEPFRNRLVVRYRIDGVLHEAAEPPLGLRAAIVSRLKIMARLNIAERRLPQDGRIRFAFRGRELDLRVATMPTLHGEAVEMRVLDRTSLVEDFAGLGFAPSNERRLLDALARPHGILLVTGPTGSGKTTTLYTGLMRLNQPGRKLFTVEDPIEYELEGINQVQVKTQIGLSFAQILRATLRHDPDVVMIGEIRDLETAEVAVQAALTGHLVLSTLHTNDAAASVARLLDMGVPEYLVTSTLNGVVAQRLVRRLCPHCRVTCEAPAHIRDQLPDAAVGTYYASRGCEACDGIGYRGRAVISEFLTASDSLRRLILARADARDIRRAAIAEGMATMFADGLRQAQAGITTVDEVMRVTVES